jgi:hypothetical protein
MAAGHMSVRRPTAAPKQTQVELFSVGPELMQAWRFIFFGLKGRRRNYGRRQVFYLIYK